MDCSNTTLSLSLCECRCGSVILPAIFFMVLKSFVVYNPLVATKKSLELANKSHEGGPAQPAGGLDTVSSNSVDLGQECSQSILSLRLGPCASVGRGLQTPLVMMWLPWLPRVGLSSNPKQTNQQTHGELMEMEGAWGDVSMSQGMPRTAMSIKSWNDNVDSP